MTLDDSNANKKKESWQDGNVDRKDDDNVAIVSISSLLLATLPLGMISAIFWYIGLAGISIGIMVGSIRTFVQLSLLGSLLQPIFMMKNVGLVILYASFMVVLAAQESSSRTKYHFDGQFFCILTSLVVNVLWVSLFAFKIILKPKPIWNPRYLIPIVGMLLGNSISAISLSLNTITTALVEKQSEIELYLSFGASQYEAVSAIVQDGIIAGATPIMNTMRVIGIISIPGTMTGQLLGGSPTLTAARYQILVTYLIALSVLSIILMNAWLVIAGVGFDSHQVLRTDRFVKNDSLGSIATIVWVLRSIGGSLKKKNRIVVEPVHGNHHLDPLTNASPSTTTGTLEFRSLKESCASIPTDDKRLEVLGLSRSFQTPTHEESTVTKRTLFEDVSLEVNPGDMILVKGPSGVGKSSFLKLIAGLGPLQEGGNLRFGGQHWDSIGGQNWRRHIRYVAQSKVDIPGTPRDFLYRVTNFSSWKLGGDDDDDISASTTNMLLTSEEHLIKWGMKSSSLDKEWSMLSGGESQRVIVAFAMSSNPNYLLLDEVTSGVDLQTKIVVEESVKKFVHSHTGGVLWVSHDSQQAERMSHFDDES